MCAVLVIAGVSGSGKSTVASLVAKELGWDMLEGDDYHSTDNKAKMAAGHALTDEDRWPWLAALRQAALERVASGRRAVVSCSALKKSYRDALRGADGDPRTGGEEQRSPRIAFVLLDPSREELHRRLAKRTGHFMPSTLLNSQLDTLEREPLTDWLCIIGTPDTPNQVKLSTIDEITAYLVQLVRELG